MNRSGNVISLAERRLDRREGTVIGRSAEEEQNIASIISGIARCKQERKTVNACIDLIDSGIVIFKPDVGSHTRANCLAHLGDLRVNYDLLLQQRMGKLEYEGDDGRSSCRQLKWQSRMCNRYNVTTNQEASPSSLSITHDIIGNMKPSIDVDPHRFRRSCATSVTDSASLQGSDGYAQFEQRVHRWGFKRERISRQRTLRPCQFGKSGPYFYGVSRGIDERQVSLNRARKSVPAERTFADDIHAY